MIVIDGHDLWLKINFTILSNFLHHWCEFCDICLSKNLCFYFLYSKYKTLFLFNEINCLKKNFLRRLNLNCSIVKFYNFTKKSFFHSLTFSRHKQFGTKLISIFGFAKCSKYKTNFKLSLKHKLQ
mgnify:CR=1 FL=1